MLSNDEISISIVFTYGHWLCSKSHSSLQIRLDSHYSTICRRQKHIDIAINYQKSSNSLHLLVDSTGLKFLGEDEWKHKKHQRKLHICIDDKILKIIDFHLTINNVSDSQVLGNLLDQIPQDEQSDSVYTDGVYDTKQCRQVSADRQSHAVIPPRINAKPWKDTKISSLERNELIRIVKRSGRTLCQKMVRLSLMKSGRNQDALHQIIR